MKCEQSDYAICCNREFGPVFGKYHDGHDICIWNYSNVSSNKANLVQSYKHPTYVNGSNKVLSFLAVSIKFLTIEIEVIAKE